MNNTDITNKTIYLCDDTIEGIFTAIYKAWDNNPKTTDVRIRSNASSLSFFESYVETDTDYELALKVYNTIIRKLSWDIYFYIYRTALSYEEERASYIYSFLKKAFKTGPAIINMLHDDDVLKIFNIDTRIIPINAIKSKVENLVKSIFVKYPISANIPNNIAVTKNINIIDDILYVKKIVEKVIPVVIEYTI